MDDAHVKSDNSGIKSPPGLHGAEEEQHEAGGIAGDPRGWHEVHMEGGRPVGNGRGVARGGRGIGRGGRGRRRACRRARRGTHCCHDGGSWRRSRCRRRPWRRLWSPACLHTQPLSILLSFSGVTALDRGLVGAPTRPPMLAIVEVPSAAPGVAAGHGAGSSVPFACIRSTS